jgi:hypothetical protein
VGISRGIQIIRSEHRDPADQGMNAILCINELAGHEAGLMIVDKPHDLDFKVSPRGAQGRYSNESGQGRTAQRGASLPCSGGSSALRTELTADGARGLLRVARNTTVLQSNAPLPWSCLGAGPLS